MYRKSDRTEILSASAMATLVMKVPMKEQDISYIQREEY